MKLDIHHALKLNKHYLGKQLEKALGDNINNLYDACFFDLILYIPSTIFQLNRDGSSWAEPVLS